jgi:uncharacterized membrane protein
MSTKTYRLCTLVIVLTLAAFFGWSIIRGIPVFIPVTGFIVALLLMMICRRFTKEVLVDERLHKIDEKASVISHRISSILMALIGLVFIAMRNTLPSEFEIVGLTLAYTVCTVTLMHLAFSYYYQNQL